MNNTSPWWQQGVIYQIYPKSFQDTTGRGTGDLQGVIKRLDYLQKLGIDAIWLTPFYLSPQIDNGYDVADYCAIDPSYGTMEDFDQLVAEAHKRGIRLILDMVFNHTSTEHNWFKSALDKNSPYRQFYIWRDGKPDTPPNNWRSKFGGNAWRWHAESGQYYLHLFAPEQADLNWENEEVRSALKKVCEFWSDRGVDGLRLDVINLVSKDTTFPSDTEGRDGRRFYTDGPRIHEFLQEFSRDAFTPLGLMTVGEMSSTSLEHCQQYGALDGRECKTLVQMYPSMEGLYSFLWLIGEAIFFYLPVGICWSTVRKLGGTPILGIVLGITLVSPQLMNAYELGSKIPEVWNFGLFSIEKVGYQAQVIPALLAGIALAYIERFMKRIVPDYLYLVIVPVVSLIIAVFLAHALIGPFGRMIGDGVAFVVRSLMTGSFAPVGAALFGFLYAPLVITGVHQTTLAVDLQMVQSMGGTPVWPLIALSNKVRISKIELIGPKNTIKRPKSAGFQR